MVSELKWIFSNFCIRSHVSYVGCRIVDIWHRSRGNFGTLCTQRSVFTVITIVLSDTPGGFILMWREIKHSLYTVQKLSETEISAHQARKLKPTKTRIHPGFLIPGFGSAGTFAALCTQRPDCTVMTTGLNYKIYPVRGTQLSDRSHWGKTRAPKNFKRNSAERFRVMEVWLERAGPWVEVLLKGVEVTVKVVKGRPK